MTKKKHLKLINTPKHPNKTDLEKEENFDIKQKIDSLTSRNFWNSCPLRYELLPETDCLHGKVERDKNGKVTKEARCDWYIESPRDKHCFWNFVRRRSDPDGNMLPMLQSEIAELFGCSPTKIHFIIKEAMKKLKDNGYLSYLAQLSDRINDPDE